MSRPGLGSGGTNDDKFKGAGSGLAKALAATRSTTQKESGLSQETIDKALSVADPLNRLRLASDPALLAICLAEVKFDSKNSKALVNTCVQNYIASLGDDVLGFFLHAAVDFFRLGKAGKAIFNFNTTFSTLREKLSEFWAKEISKIPSVANSVLAKSNSNDEGTMTILLTDEGGWSREISFGNFATNAKMLMEKGCSASKPVVVTLRSNRDPMSPRVRLSELQYSVRHNKFMNERVGELIELGFTGYRSIRGDGNCYFRAVAIGFFELGLENEDLNERKRFMRKIADRLTLLGDLVRRMHSEEIGKLHDTLITWLPKCLTWEKLESSILMNASLDQALVRAMRCLVTEFMCENKTKEYNGLSIETSVLALWEDVSSVEDYCQNYVCRMGRDAEGTLADIGILFTALDCRGVIVHVDSMPNLRQHNSGEGNETNGTVYLLLRSGMGDGHYDLLYFRQMNANKQRLESLQASAIAAPEVDDFNEVYSLVVKPTATPGSPVARASASTAPTAAVTAASSAGGSKRGGKSGGGKARHSPTLTGAPAPGSDVVAASASPPMPPKKEISLYEAQFGPNAVELPDYLAAVPDISIPESNQRAEETWSQESTGGSGSKSRKASSSKPAAAVVPPIVTQGVSGTDKKTKAAKTSDVEAEHNLPLTLNAPSDYEDSNEAEYEYGASAVTDEDAAFSFEAEKEELTLQQKILEAARSGQAETLKGLIDEALRDKKPLAIIDQAHQAERNQAPIHAACERGHLECVKLLLAVNHAGMKVNLTALSQSRFAANQYTKNAGMTPLMWACFNTHLPVVEYLLQLQEESAKYIGNQDSDFALRCALNSAVTSGGKKQMARVKKVIAALAENGVRMTQEQELMLEKREISVYKSLLSVEETESPSVKLHFAASQGDVPALAALLKTPHGVLALTKIAERVESPLVAAAKGGHYEALEFLINYPPPAPSEIQTPLISPLSPSISASSSSSTSASAAAAAASTLEELQAETSSKSGVEGKSFKKNKEEKERERELSRQKKARDREKEQEEKMCRGEKMQNPTTSASKFAVDPRSNTGVQMLLDALRSCSSVNSLDCGKMLLDRVYDEADTAARREEILFTLAQSRSGSLLTHALKTLEQLAQLPSVRDFNFNRDDKLVKKLRSTDSVAFDFLEGHLKEMKKERDHHDCCALGCDKQGTLSCTVCKDKYKLPTSKIEWFCSKECFKASYAEHKAKVHDPLDAEERMTKAKAMKRVNRALNEGAAMVMSDSENESETEGKDTELSEEAILELEEEVRKIMRDRQYVLTVRLSPEKYKSLMPQNNNSDAGSRLQSGSYLKSRSADSDESSSVGSPLSDDVDYIDARSPQVESESYLNTESADNDDFDLAISPPFSNELTQTTSFDSDDEPI